MNDAPSARVPPLAHVLSLLDGIERHGPGSPGAIGFRSALHRAGREADAAGGPEAVTGLLAAITEADPDRAEARDAITQAVWSDLLSASPEPSR